MCLHYMQIASVCVCCAIICSWLCVAYVYHLHPPEGHFPPPGDDKYASNLHTLTCMLMIFYVLSLENSVKMRIPSLSAILRILEGCLHRMNVFSYTTFFSTIIAAV